MKTKAFIILLSLFLWSCEPMDNEPNLLNFEPSVIAKDNLYGAGAEGIEEQKIIITDERTWKSLMAQMNSVNNVSDNFSETNIDFSQYVVIAVFDKVLTTGGHNLDLHVNIYPESILVKVNTVGTGEIATTVMTQPFHIVKIPVSNLPIIFE